MMDCRHVHFQYTKTLDQEDLVQLIQLFQRAAFWACDRTPEDMAIAIAHSHPIVTAWDGDRLIGFARATSDGIYRATIWDVVIHPDYQGAGLGRRLVETVLGHPHLNRVERVYLMTSNQQRFYERVGFQENTTTTMVLHNQTIAPMPSLVGLDISQGEPGYEVG
jgi:N-acetylglutamate synthase-like GNAT family acetyltransferase